MARLIRLHFFKDNTLVLINPDHITSVHAMISQSTRDEESKPYSQITTATNKQIHVMESLEEIATRIERPERSPS